MVHSVLENADFSKPLDFFDMRNLFEDYRAHFDPDNEITQDLIDVGYEILAEFCRSWQDDKWHVVEKEAAFAIIIGSALVVGYIDRVDEIGNCIIISDYKTGKNEVAAKNVPYDFQLGIYALAMKKRFPDKRIIAQFDYLRSGKIKAHEFTDSDLADMEEKLIAAINGIIDTKDFRPTSNKYFCKWCNHAESHDGKPPACTIGAKRVGNLT